MIPAASGITLHSGQLVCEAKIMRMGSQVSYNCHQAHTVVPVLCPAHWWAQGAGMINGRSCAAAQRAPRPPGTPGEGARRAEGIFEASPHGAASSSPVKPRTECKKKWPPLITCAVARAFV